MDKYAWYLEVNAKLKPTIMRADSECTCRLSPTFPTYNAFNTKLGMELNQSWNVTLGNSEIHNIFQQILMFRNISRHKQFGAKIWIRYAKGFSLKGRPPFSPPPLKFFGAPQMPKPQGKPWPYLYKSLCVLICADSGCAYYTNFCAD